MKKIFYPILAAAAILTACNEEVITDGTGSLSFRIGEVADQYYTKADAVNTDEFFVTLSDWNGNAVTVDGVTYSNIPYKNLPAEISGLPSGPYTVTVSSHEETPAAAFDTPVYGGSTSFNVKTGATTPVSVKCSVQNVKVTVNPSANFLSELTTYTITVKNEHGGTIHWTNNAEMTGTNVASDLTLPAHFSVSALDVTVTGYRKISGAEVNLEENANWNGKITDVAAADHHIINIDAQTTGGIGGATDGENGITLIVDGTGLNEVNTELNVPGYEDVGVDGPDRGENEDDGDDSGDDNGTNSENVTILWPGNEIETSTGLYKTMDIQSGMTVELTVSATAGIKGFVVKLTSDTPSFMSMVCQLTSDGSTDGAPDEAKANAFVAQNNYAILDLIGDPVAVKSLGNVGLKTGSEIEGKEEVLFSLSTLVPLIPTAGGADPDTYHTFTLTVTDNNGESSTWPLTFHVPASN